jgi:hypothetical protein
MSTKESTMQDRPMLPRLGAASGALFALILFIAVGDGTGPFSAPRAIAGTAAITLALPFLAYLFGLLRRAEGPDGWLAPVALVAGAAGITLKLSSGVPELAIHRIHAADGTAMHRALIAIGDAATLVALYPLAVCCAATAVVALRTGALPRWLGVGAALTAAALAANGCFVETDVVPALLLFLIWTLLASIALVRDARRAPRPAPRTDAAATA